MFQAFRPKGLPTLCTSILIEKTVSGVMTGPLCPIDPSLECVIGSIRDLRHCDQLQASRSEQSRIAYSVISESSEEKAALADWGTKSVRKRKGRENLESDEGD
jgi:hypothetical protein